jgi:isopentenyldiphosphate isomerase
MQQLAVVDESDNVITPADYEQVHTRGLLHRFVLVYVFDNNRMFFLQKRAAGKPHGRLLAESVCAHVRYGEDYFHAAKRRMGEELGLVDGIELSEVTKTRVHTIDKNWTNNAFVKIYECITPYKPSINRNEIEEISFYPLELVKDMFDRNPTSFVPGFKETFDAYLHATEQKE